MHPLEAYLSRLAEIRASGAGTEETSYYPALDTLLNAVGGDLKPADSLNWLPSALPGGQPAAGLAGTGADRTYAFQHS